MKRSRLKTLNFIFYIGFLPDFLPSLLILSYISNYRFRRIGLPCRRMQWSRHPAVSSNPRLNHSLHLHSIANTPVFPVWAAYRYAFRSLLKPHKYLQIVYNLIISIILDCKTSSVIINNNYVLGSIICFCFKMNIFVIKIQSQNRFFFAIFCSNFSY